MATFEISEDYTRHGIRLILDNVSQYVKDARLLVSDSSVAHATVLTLYASEELGKASLLFQAKENRKFVVDSRLFRSKNAHRLKMEEARHLLGDSVILQSSVIGRARVPFILGAPDVEASPNLRMDCTYVDFRDEKWVFGASFPVEHLANLLNRLEEEASRLRTKISQ